MQVLKALARAKSNKDISRILEISPRTVETHRANLISMLDAKARRRSRPHKDRCAYGGVICLKVPWERDALLELRARGV